MDASDSNKEADFEEIEKHIPSAVVKLRSVLQDDYNIRVPTQCDNFLARCCRQKDGKLEDAVRLIRGYHDTIPNFKHWDAEISPASAVEVHDVGVLIPLKYRDPNGRYVLIVRPGLWDPTKINFDQAVASIWMIAQYAHSEMVDVQRHGYVAIWDFTGISAQQLWAVKLRRILALVKWAKNGVGGRIKAIHLINHPKAVDHILKAIRPFLNEKLKNRMILHDGVDSLLQHVDRKCLSIALGGVLDQELTDAKLMQNFRNSGKYFKDMITMGFITK